MTLSKPRDNANSHHELDLHLTDEKFMLLALKLAKQGEKIGEVPVGAIIVDKAGRIIAKATNVREKQKTTLGHAELVAIHRACKKLNSWRLSGCSLYVTLEPCFMCAGALVQSRISRVVFGAHDPKGGALKSLSQLGNDSRLNHQFDLTSGVLAKDCSLLLKEFFKKKRKLKS
ncbi:MAG: nucleoside deaminase [Bdellovibrionota bacterium]